MDLFFGKKKNEAKRPSSSETIQNMRNTLEIIEKREKYIQGQIDSLKQKAKEFLAKKDKAQALYCVKKYKILEKEKENLLNTKLNLEIQIMNLSDTVITLEIVQAMTQGRDALKSQTQLKADDVANIMDELQEAMDEVKEIGECLSRPLGPEVTEEDLVELSTEIMAEEASQKPQLSLTFPEAPSHVPAVPKDTEIEKLKTILS